LLGKPYLSGFQFVLRILGALIALSLSVCLLVCVFLVLVSMSYRYQASQLQKLYVKQHAADLRVWTAKVCADMARYPEKWIDPEIKRLPCGNDVEQDREDVLTYADESRYWRKRITQQEAEWKQSESGHFGFLVKKINTYSDTTWFGILPDRLIAYLKWSFVAFLLFLLLVAPFCYPQSKRPLQQKGQRG
jgi:hypothetical protein